MRGYGVSEVKREIIKRDFLVTQVTLMTAQCYKLKIISNRRFYGTVLTFDHRVRKSDSGPLLLDEFCRFRVEVFSPVVQNHTYGDGEEANRK